MLHSYNIYEIHLAPEPHGITPKKPYHVVNTTTGLVDYRARSYAEARMVVGRYAAQLYETDKFEEELSQQMAQESGKAKVEVYDARALTKLN